VQRHDQGFVSITGYPPSMKMQRCVWLARYGSEFGPPPATSGDNKPLSPVSAVELKTKMQTHRDRHGLSRPAGLILRFASKSNINSSGHVLLSGGVAVGRSLTVPGCPAASLQAERNRIGRGHPLIWRPRRRLAAGGGKLKRNELTSPPGKGGALQAAEKPFRAVILRRRSRRRTSVFEFSSE
jgi:hypothetical protein